MLAFAHSACFTLHFKNLPNDHSTKQFLHNDAAANDHVRQNVCLKDATLNELLKARMNQAKLHCKKYFLAPWTKIFVTLQISFVSQKILLGVCRVGAPGAEVFGHGCHTILLDMVQRQVCFDFVSFFAFHLLGI